jgi:hypothetical protein
MHIRNNSTILYSSQIFIHSERPLSRRGDWNEEIQVLEWSATALLFALFLLPGKESCRRSRIMAATYHTGQWLLCRIGDYLPVKHYTHYPDSVIASSIEQTVKGAYYHYSSLECIVHYGSHQESERIKNDPSGRAIKCVPLTKMSVATTYCTYCIYSSLAPRPAY